MRVTLCCVCAVVLAVSASVTAGAESLDHFKGVYEKRLAEIDADYATRLGRINADYKTGLLSIRERAQRSGDLDMLRWVLSELERHENEQTLPQSKDELIEDIKPLLQRCRKLADEAGLGRAQTVLSLAAHYDRALETFQRNLTREGKVDAASAVQAARIDLTQSEALATARALIDQAAKRVPAQPVVSDPSNVDMSAVFRSMLHDAPVPGHEGIIRQLPERFTDCRPAFGGAYLVFRFPEMKRLGVFNIAQLKFETYIPISSPDTIYAAGATVMLVYDRNQNVFELYDMLSFERRRSSINRVRGVVTEMEIAALRNDRALISWADDTAPLAWRHYGWLELRTMKIEPIRSAHKDTQATLHSFYNRYRNNVHLRLDPQGQRLLAWVTSHSPHGFLYGSFDRDRITTIYGHHSYGSLMFLPDRSRIVGTRGKLLDSQGVVRHDFPQHNAAVFAVQGANQIIRAVEDKAALIDAINLKELRSFDLPFKIGHIQTHGHDKYTTDRQVYAVSALDRVAFIDQGGLQVAVFSLSGAGDAPGGIPSSVRPGEVWTHRLTVADGSIVRIEDAPPGVAYDPDTRVLSWSIPESYAVGSQLILLSIATPGQAEAYQRVVVDIR